MQKNIPMLLTVAGFFGVNVWTVIAYVQSLFSPAPLKVIGSVEFHSQSLLLLMCVEPISKLRSGLN